MARVEWYALARRSACLRYLCRLFGLPAFVNQKPAIIILIFRLPGANVIETVDHIKATLSSRKASIPTGDNLGILTDLTTTIRASVNKTLSEPLVISILLVIGVVFAFLRSPRGTLIPGVAVGVSLIGTFGVMYLVGYSLDNLSLMALTISTGFVVDDAIVVMENITRLIEGRHAGHGGVSAGRTGSRLHCTLHEPFFDRGFCTHSVYGRDRWADFP